MTKIKFDNDSLQVQILPRINKTIENLNVLISFNNGISIPNGFAYTSFFNEYCNSLSQIRDSYIKQRELLENANKRIETVLNNMNDDLYSIKDINIKARGEIL